MPPVNATATRAATSATPFAQNMLPSAAHRLSGASTRNQPLPPQLYVIPDKSVSGGRPAHDAQLPVPCPVYNGLLTANEIPDFLKETGAICDQTSLEKAWTSLENRLRTQSVSEDDVLQILESGVLQTDTGKTLAPLLSEAILRSIKPLAGLAPERLREFVETICHLPPARWANSFGEDTNFPRGNDGKGVQGFIQKQITASRAQREQQVANGELLDDDTWKALKEFTQQSRGYIPESSVGTLNETLRQLEDLIHIRPSPKEAQSLMADFAQAMKESSPNERERWSVRFPGTVQQLKERLEAIEKVDKRPDRSWLPVNMAFSPSDAISVIQNNANSLLLNVHDFIFGTPVESALTAEIEPRQPESALLATMVEIERKSSFYNEVITTGPRYTGGLFGKVLYVLNALDTVGVLSIAERVKPHLPAVPVPALPADQTNKRVEEAVVSSEPANESSSTTPNETTSFEQLAQSVLNTLSEFDNLLKFPAAEAYEPVVHDFEMELHALMDVEAGGISESPYRREEHSEAVPGWWQSIGPQIYTALTGLLAGMANSAVASGAVLTRQIRENPVATGGYTVAAVSAIATITSIYNHFNTQYPGQTPNLPAPGEQPGTGNRTSEILSTASTPPTPETSTASIDPAESVSTTQSAAVQQEQIEEKIEDILAPLSDTILQLMYQSTEHNLLDDAQLLHNVAMLLEQHSTKDAVKSYAELIEEVEEPTHGLQDLAQSEEIAQSPSRRVKREATFGESGAQSGAVIPDAEVPGENASDNEALLIQYLATMQELERPAPDLIEDIDSETQTDPALNSAREVVRLLRNRRSVGWADASRANGDAQLISSYTTALAQAFHSTPANTDINVVVPSHSTFGQCWLNYVRAFSNPFFTDWATKVGLDLATAKIDTNNDSLSGRVGESRALTTFTLTDNSGWANVAGPILQAAEVIAPTLHTVSSPSPSFGAPLNLVASFHGESLPTTKADAERRAIELSANPVFSSIDADETFRPREARSEAAVESQKRKMGDITTRHRLVMALNDLIRGKPDDQSVSLDFTLVSPDSSFAAKYPLEAQRLISAYRYISANGWIVPTTVAGVRNLVEMLSNPLPVAPKTGNYQGACGYSRPLTPAQRNLISTTTASRVSLARNRGLLDLFLSRANEFTPLQGLKLALSSTEATSLGRALSSDLNVISTNESAGELVMAALLLDLDPTFGQQRNQVAGYNLTQQANWGAKPSAVVANLESHLVADGKVSTGTAPVAAYHLLAASAPEFLVKNLPNNLVCGTHTWAMLRIGVARIEQIAPGTSAQMTFEQVMKYADTLPITVGQQIAEQSVTVNPLIDWAIANGVIPLNAGDTYTLQQLVIAQEKFHAYRLELSRARDYLSAPTPTRNSLALAELTRIYGEGVPFEVPCLKDKNAPQSARTGTYSLLDLYVSGQLKRNKWASFSSKVSIAYIESKISQLSDLTQLFTKSFNNYFDNLQSGSESIFKYLISQLPLDDRTSLELGTQKFYSLRSEIVIPKEDQTPTIKNAHKGRHGLLIRSEHQNKVSYFEVFPSSGQIRKRTLPDNLVLGGRDARVPNPDNSDRIIKIEAAVPRPFDWEAYQNGSSPRNNVRSDVIIEEMVPQEMRTKQTGFGYQAGLVHDVFSSSSWVNHVASVAVEEHFITGRDELLELAKGTTIFEQEYELVKKVGDFLYNLVPFKTCVDNFSAGKIEEAITDCSVDAAGFIIPGIGAANKVARVAGTGAKLLPKVLKITWITGRSLVTNANPFDGVGDLPRMGYNVVKNLGAEAQRAAIKGVDQLKNLFGSTKALDPTYLSKRADMTDGVVGADQVARQTEKVKAVYKDGNWYAFNVNENRPYGPPLEHFRPDTTIGLERTTFSDGTSALTPSRLFDKEAHTIQRSSHTDVVVGDDVYRLDPGPPAQLKELTSPTYFKGLEGFEDVCSTGNRSKRSPTACFSKLVVQKQSRAEKQLQSIEHKRLHPSRAAAGGIRKVVHERRIFTLADDGQTLKLLPSPLTEPLQFRSQTTGSVIQDRHFGLWNKGVDADLDSKTRVLRVDGIVHGIDDQRDARGFLVDYDFQNTGVKHYAVVESDTGLYYYCEYNSAITNNISFRKIDTLYADSLGNGLIKEHDKIKDQFLVKAGIPVNNDFVALPPLDSIYSDLVFQKGFTPRQIAELKSKTALLTKEQQREFVLNVWNKGKNRNVEIASETIKIRPIAKGPGFSAQPVIDQNKALADAAKAIIDEQFAATGLRSANQVIANDPNDLQRQVLTRPVVIWAYTRTKAPNYADQILRTGAGNCDQMAWAAKKIIEESGGIAQTWNMPGAHTFTLVGVPPGTVTHTVDFSEPAFTDAWVVDPWAEISCKATEYTTRLELQMISWEFDGKMLMMTDWLSPNPTSGWRSPIDPLWIAQLIQGQKLPS
ncbi:hypothetical protein M1M11_01005 [Pseudomonas azerbaijanoccidens]|uniref:hypothetical protein n=1 Tax=Pseudomonas azerbaijanoccidentalis TaxID=2842347 RepID=UPI00200B631A|nr:hypothetical protein [Pseudomonas azerbaijanoccidentalis]MCK8663470.1 hypothetical protein [Pseudomonas azerbaijanoccidentalis]